MNRLSRLPILLLLFPLLFLFACNGGSGGSSLADIVAQADNAEVILTSVTSMSGEGGSTDLSGTTTDKAEIQRLIDGISGGPAEEFKCGYDGKILLKKGDETLLDIDYNLDPECQHAAYMIGDELKMTRFTEDGVTFLEEILIRGA